MRIIIDVMSGDSSPEELVRGGLMAEQELGITPIFVGDGKIISAIAPESEVIQANQVVGMNDEPRLAIKEKPDASVTVALRALAEGRGDALVSPGNTGALLVQATLIVKRIKGIRRAALAPFIPTIKEPVLLIDSGANAQCTAEYLLQFAIMGKSYAELVLGRENPRVGLLNIGTEPHKGDSLRLEAYALLKNAGELINFVGNIEARDAHFAKCDVLVADGYSGNILLKAMEGTAKFFSSELKNILFKSARTKLGALMLKNDLNDLKKRFDHGETGGAPLLGISAPVFKAHGSVGARELKNAIRQAVKYVDNRVVEKICDDLKTSGE